MGSKNLLVFHNQINSSKSKLQPLISYYLYLCLLSQRISNQRYKIKKEFPFLNICVWNTSSINEFMRHQPGRFYFIIEVEKDSTQSVFYYLKELDYAVFLEPTIDILSLIHI